MATINLAAIWKLAALAAQAAKNPLVQKFMDNMVKGTPTKIDDWVWSALKVLMGVPAEEATVSLPNKLEEIQAKYDSLTPEEKAEAKQPSTTINPADPFGVTNENEIGNG